MQLTRIYHKQVEVVEALAESTFLLPGLLSHFLQSVYDLIPTTNEHSENSNIVRFSMLRSASFIRVGEYELSFELIIQLSSALIAG